MTINRDEVDAPDRRRLFWLGGAAGVLLIPLLVIWWPGCRQYPPVSSRESLKLLQLLNTACNTRDQARLAQVEKRLSELEQQGKLTAQEKAGYVRIIGEARAGKWEDAEKAAFKMAEDQLGQGNGEPEHYERPPPKKSKGK